MCSIPRGQSFFTSDVDPSRKKNSESNLLKRNGYGTFKFEGSNWIRSFNLDRKHSPAEKSQLIPQAKKYINILGTYNMIV